jgi:hypothetical protein
VTATGRYTAPSSGPGTDYIIASAGGTADTSRAIVLPPPPSIAGIPFGASQLWGSLGEPGTQSLELVHDGIRASSVIQRIADARAKGVKLLFNLTPGHDPYMSTINGVLQFDMQKWRDSMATYNTPPIKAAVAQAVADGVVIGNSVMDEPHVVGLGDGNTWGPPGTMTKARVDSMCGYAKSILPTLPEGVVHQHQLFEPTKSYRVCEFLVDQYVDRLGPPEKFRADGLAMAKRDGMRVLFGLNLLNGGTQDRDGMWDCKDQGGFKGQASPNCQMTPAQVVSWSTTIAPGSCGFRFWRWDDVRLTGPAYTTAFTTVATQLAGLERVPCSRP